MSEIRRARARDREPQITQINADYLISHRLTQTHRDRRQMSEVRCQMSDVRDQKSEIRDLKTRII